MLEVLLAVVLMILLAGAVYGFYNQVLSARQGSNDQADAVFAQRRVLDTVAGEIQAAVFSPVLQMGVEGLPDQVRFMRTALPSGAVYARRGLFTLADEAAGEAAPIPPQHDIQQITYRLNRYVDEDGVEQIGGLERVCVRTITAQTIEEAPLTTLLTDRIKFLRLQYWDGAAWQDTWGGGDLPPAVMVTIGREPLPEGSEIAAYPFETAWRVVAIPTGKASPQTIEVLADEPIAAEPAGGAGRSGGAGADSAGGGRAQTLNAADLARILGSLQGGGGGGGGPGGGLGPGGGVGPGGGRGGNAGGSSAGADDGSSGGGRPGGGVGPGGGRGGNAGGSSVGADDGSSGGGRPGGGVGPGGSGRDGNQPVGPGGGRPPGGGRGAGGGRGGRGGAGGGVGAGGQGDGNTAAAGEPTGSGSVAPDANADDTGQQPTNGGRGRSGRSRRGAAGGTGAP